jgi:hypothetical protein
MGAPPVVLVALLCSVAFALPLSVAYRIRSSSLRFISPLSIAERLDCGSIVTSTQLLGFNLTTGEAWSVALSTPTASIQPSLARIGTHDSVLITTGTSQLVVYDCHTSVRLTVVPLSVFVVAPITAVDLGERGVWLVMAGGASDQSVRVRNASAQEMPLLWSYAARDTFTAAPVIVADVRPPLVVVGGERSKLHAIDMETGQSMWVATLRGQVSDPPIVLRRLTGDVTGVVASTTSDVLEAFDVAGRPLWTSTLESSPSAPLIAWGIGESVLCGLTSGVVLGINSSSGSRRWTIGGNSVPIAGCAANVDLGGWVVAVCATTAGQLFAIQEHDGVVVGVGDANESIIGAPRYSPQLRRLFVLTPTSLLAVDMLVWSQSFSVTTRWPPAAATSVTSGRNVNSAVIIGCVCAVVVVIVLGVVVFTILRRRGRTAGAAVQLDNSVDVGAPRQQEPFPMLELADPHPLVAAPTLNALESARAKLHEEHAASEISWDLLRFLTDDAVTIDAAGVPQLVQRGGVDVAEMRIVRWIITMEGHSARAVPTGVTLATGGTGFECSICFCLIIPRADGTVPCVCCVAPRRHFVCAECANGRLTSYFDEEGHDLERMICPVAPCGGRWQLTDLTPLLQPITLRRWHEMTVAVTTREVQSRLSHQHAYSDPLRAHLAAIQSLLEPRCPHCGLQFESFSGCVSVRCGVLGRGLGCNQLFCGACWSTFPCPKGHGHNVLSKAELQASWKEVRRARLVTYLGQVPRDEQHRVRQAAETMFIL